MLAGKCGDDVHEVVEVQVGGMGGAIVDAEAAVDDRGESSRIAGGLHVNIGIADYDCFGGTSAEFAENGVGA